MSSLAARLATMATAALALILLVTFTGTGAVVIERAHALGIDLTPDRSLEARAIAAGARGADKLGTAAPRIVAALDAEGFRSAVFDAKGTFVAGDRDIHVPPPVVAAQTREVRSSKTGLPESGQARPFFGRGPHPLIVRIGGANVFAFGDSIVAVRPSRGAMVREMLPIWFAQAALAGGLLCIFYVMFRGAAREALRPLDTVARSLRELGAGDYAKQRLAMSGTSELIAIGDAYNEAAEHVAEAMHENRRTRERMRQFVADAGHELRTPLTVIAGYIDILRRGAIAERAIAEQILTTMNYEKEHMRSLIDRLIRLSRLDAEAPPNTVAIELESVLRAHASTAQHLDPQRDVTYSVEGEIKVLADRDELAEALWNVIENALKYAPGAPIEMRAREAGKNVVITLRDDGPGMTDTERLQAFERFFRGDARGDATGSGLGLAIAKRAVERSGGTIELHSAPGEGTTAVITLPAANAV